MADGNRGFKTGHVFRVTRADVARGFALCDVGKWAVMDPITCVYHLLKEEQRAKELAAAMSQDS